MRQCKNTASHQWTCLEELVIDVVAGNLPKFDFRNGIYAGASGNTYDIEFGITQGLTKVTDVQ